MPPIRSAVGPRRLRLGAAATSFLLATGLLATGLLATSAAAQKHLYTVVPSGAGDAGRALAGAGDVNRDGLPDFAAGAPASGPSGEGAVLVLSGNWGTPLRTITGLAQGDAFGAALAGGRDVNLDGWPDLLVGAPFAPLDRSSGGYVRLHSGKDGSILAIHTAPSLGIAFGQAVAFAGDVDRDGYQDVAAASPYENDDVTPRRMAGGVRVFSGRDGSVLRSWLGETEGARLGSSLATAGDTDADGVEDLVIGAPLGGVSGQGVVEVRSGRTGARLWRAAGDASHPRFGRSVAGAGDVDGDGRDDVVVGAQGQVRATDGGSVLVLSGRDGSVLLYVDGEAAYEQLGTCVGGLGDVDADGKPDFWAASPEDATTRRGFLKAFSGRTGRELWLCDVDEDGTRFAASAAVVGDVDKDRVADLVIGTAGRGHVRVVSSALLPLSVNKHYLSVTWGATMRFDLYAGDRWAGRPYLLLGSISGTAPGVRLGSLQIPLNPDAYTWLSLGLPNSQMFQGTFGVLGQDGRGRAYLQLLPGQGEPLRSQTLYHAYVVFDGRGPAWASNAVEARVGS